ncbi:BLOC-3 complex member HPS1 isoform X1 [Onthophagus taurus]|uniref:BLOC-3 complex member HPS1 isoform X1 n=1 Tax=Onthophagus taurus TaxID=166361 RepID=UPI0039BE1A91
MKCVIIFDHTNDVIYSKYDEKFIEHVKIFARNQGLITGEESEICANVLVQIFSPIVTSHRIMNCQFGNSYTSIQCQKDINLTFEDYMGYLFMYVSNDNSFTMAKYLSVCVTLARYVCGPNILILKTDENKANLMTRLIDTWNYLTLNDQAIFIEAIEQLLVNVDLTKTTVQILRESVDKLQNLTEYTKIHGLLMVNNKFLGLYSTQKAKDLSSADILFSILLCEINKNEPKDNSEILNNSSHEILLSGNDQTPKCIPYNIYIREICENINLVFFIETGSAVVSGSLYDAFSNLHSMQLVQIQRNVSTLKPAFENLDNSIKKLFEAIKKLKNVSLKGCIENLGGVWEFMRKKYQEFIKNRSPEALLRAESLTCGLLDGLKELLVLITINGTVLLNDTVFLEHLGECTNWVCEKLSSYEDFLKVKSLKNFTLGSNTSSLTIHKYLEEFPGLVHFIYVDRTNHRITAPGIDFNTEEIVVLTRNKIWSMIKFAQLHLNEGHTSIIWKDMTFSYAYFLWFEDVSGSPLKPTVSPMHFNRSLPIPGTFCDDYYRHLKEACFPKMPPQKIRCYELYTIHLGLVTTQCVLEHTRRLSATIWELKGHPDHPIDLL